MPFRFDDIVEKLKHHPEVRYETGDRNLSVFPSNPSGFRVTITEAAPNAFDVHLDGWPNALKHTKQLAIALYSRSPVDAD